MIIGRKKGRPRSSLQLVPVLTMVTKEIANELTRISRLNGRSRSAHLSFLLENFIKEQTNETKQTL